jgi:hypothetical protein
VSSVSIVIERSPLRNRDTTPGVDASGLCGGVGRPAALNDVPELVREGGAAGGLFPRQGGRFMWTASGCGYAAPGTSSARFSIADLGRFPYDKLVAGRLVKGARHKPVAL